MDKTPLAFPSPFTTKNKGAHSGDVVLKFSESYWLLLVPATVPNSASNKEQIPISESMKSMLYNGVKPGNAGKGKLRAFWAKRCREESWGARSSGHNAV